MQGQRHKGRLPNRKLGQKLEAANARELEETGNGGRVPGETATRGCGAWERRGERHARGGERLEVTK